MRILLDTNVFLWYLSGDDRLSEAARTLYLDERNSLALSVASLWEIFIKIGTGKLCLASDDPVRFLHEQMAANAISTMGITMEHAAGILKLPPIHKDPFDRLIISQALHENLPVLSSDTVFKEYGVRNFF